VLTHLAPDRHLALGGQKARTDYDIGLAFQDGLDHLRDFSKLVPGVGVEADEDAGLQLEGGMEAAAERCRLGGVAGMADDGGSSCLGQLGGAVHAAIVYDDDVLGVVTSLQNDAGDEVLF
jgi:hypothetical protein